MSYNKAKWFRITEIILIIMFFDDDHKEDGVNQK